VKKYLGLTLTILSIMCFITVFNAKGVESYKLNKGYIHTDLTDKIPQNISLEDLHTPKLEKNEGANTKTQSPKSQENIPLDLDEAITQHTQKSSVAATKSKEKREIDPRKPMVALTFDDGPHFEYTLQILDSLKKYNGLATFFVLGSRAEKYKSVIKSIAENGNQIGNHTYDHRELTKLSKKTIMDEITKTTDILQDITNIKPSLIRPTYGSVNNNVKLYSGAPLILWSIDTLDWKTKNDKLVIKEVLENVKDGDIILMHDIYKTTALAAKVIIKELSSQGYQMVTIDELYKAKRIDLVSGRVYKNAYSKKQKQN